MMCNFRWGPSLSGDEDIWLIDYFTATSAYAESVCRGQRADQVHDATTYYLGHQAGTSIQDARTLRRQLVLTVVIAV